MVSSACHQFIPEAMRPAASVYVVITTAMPIHIAAMFQVDHVRRDGPAGARSRLKYGESATARSIRSTSSSLFTARSSRLTTLRSLSLASSVTLGIALLPGR